MTYVAVSILTGEFCRYSQAVCSQQAVEGVTNECASLCMDSNAGDRSFFPLSVDEFSKQASGLSSVALRSLATPHPRITRAGLFKVNTNVDDLEDVKTRRIFPRCYPMS